MEKGNGEIGNTHKQASLLFQKTEDIRSNKVFSFYRKMRHMRGHSYSRFGSHEDCIRISATLCFFSFLFSFPVKNGWGNVLE